MTNTEYMNLQDYLNEKIKIPIGSIVVNARYSPSKIHDELGGEFNVYFSEEMKDFLQPWKGYLSQQATKYTKFPQFASGPKDSGRDVTYLGYKEMSSITASRLVLFYLFPDAYLPSVEQAVRTIIPKDGNYTNCTIENLYVILKGHSEIIPILHFRGMYERHRETLFDKNVLSKELVLFNVRQQLDNTKEHDCRHWHKGGHSIERTQCPRCTGLATHCKTHDGLVLLCNCESKLDEYD